MSKLDKIISNKPNNDHKEIKSLDDLYESKEESTQESNSTQDTHESNLKDSTNSVSIFLNSLDDIENRSQVERIQPFITMSQRIKVDKIIYKLNLLSRLHGKRPAASTSSVIRLLIDYSADEIDKLIDKEL